MDFTREQEQAVALGSEFALSDRRVMRLAGYAGTGKCLGFDTPVLMFDGSIRAVQDVRVGDQVMGPDSLPRTAKALGRGRSPMYRVVPVKGEPWVCNDDHILTLTGTNNFYSGKVVDVSVKDYLAGKVSRKEWKLFRVGYEAEAKELPYDPYLVGLWLGDGTKGEPRITNCAPEIHAYVEQEAARVGLRYRLVPEPRNNTQRIELTTPRGQPNPLRLFLKKLLDDNRMKFVPHDYLTGSTAQRAALLAGLLDTDGYLVNGGFDFISESKKLCSAVVYLARSLGLAAYQTECVKGIRSTGFSSTYHRCSISGDCDRIPTRVAKKQAPARKQGKRVTVTGFSLEPLGEGDYYGFELDGDGRFLLGDFTVTHNTTIAAEVARAFDSVAWCSFTGKAASVMRTKGCEDATTIHRLIYTVREGSMARLVQLQTELEQARAELRVCPDEWRRVQVRSHIDVLERHVEMEERALGRPSFVLNDKSEAWKVSLLGVDEASMVDRRVGEDITSFPAKVLAIYDPFQLPPVGGGGYFTDRPPDVTLTEVHRQARDSGILNLATVIREGGWYQYGWYNADCEVVRRGDRARNLQLMLAADQVLVGRNETRRHLNALVRSERGFTSDLPVEGDRLVCTKNDHDVGLLNGSMWEVRRVDGVRDRKVDMVVAPLDETGSANLFVSAWASVFESGQEPPSYEVREGHCFDFGYALTVHKAQGSQWGSVYLVDEGAFMGPEMHPRHAYTGITRAAEKLVVSGTTT